MKSKYILILFGILLVMLLFILSVIRIQRNPTLAVEKILPDLPGIFSEKISVMPGVRPFPHYIVSDENNEVISLVVSSDDLQIVRHGYKNKIEVIVCFSPDGVIQHVKLGKHVESSHIIDRINASGWIGQWQGIKAKDNYPDAVTGATFTTEAVSAIIQEIFSHLRNTGLSAL